MFQESDQFINNMEGLEDVSASAATVAQPTYKAPYDAVTGKRLSWDTKIDGKKVITYSQLNNRWPHDVKTGERLEWGTKIDGKKVISYSQMKHRWPYDATTGEKLKWGAKIDGNQVITEDHLRKNWPYDKRTGKKLEWGARGTHVVSYQKLNKLRPIDKVTGKPLPYGTPLGGNVVTRYVFSKEYTFVGSDNKTYKGEDAKAKALLENPNLTFKSKKEPHTDAETVAQRASKASYDAITGQKLSWGTEVDGEKVISYSQMKHQWPYDAITGKKLPQRTKIDGKQVITDDQIRKRWPYDATTGEKLKWGTKIDGEKVISYSQMHNKWPHDATSGEKLKWGTKIDGKTVITHYQISSKWPHDERTGEKLEWGTTGAHVVSYQQLNSIRPTDKATGKSLPYGTPLGGNVVTRYVFSKEYTFVGSDKKTYKGENTKEKALSENPNLTFKSKKEIQAEKRRAKTIAKKKPVSNMLEKSAACEPQTASAPAPSFAADDWIDIEAVHIADSQPLDDIVRELMESISAPSAIPPAQMSSEDELSLIAPTPTLELELNALLEGIDTSAPLVQPQAFLPVYSATTTDTTTSDSTMAKQSKRNDNDTAAIMFSPNSLNR